MEAHRLVVAHDRRFDMVVEVAQNSEEWAEVACAATVKSE
jgi:hypothetical protein